ILLEEEIDRPAFLLLNEKKLKDYGFKVGSVVKLLDLIVKLNGEKQGSSIEKVEYCSDNNENNTYLPETASGLLRYYELWNCHYTKWPSLNEFSECLSDVKKNHIHNPFKNEKDFMKVVCRGSSRSATTCTTGGSDVYFLCP
ncbi:18625_t:CDS:2, partial [Funneliformis geosporum]